MSVINKKNAAHFFAVPAALIALSVQASAIDFNKASDKRIYCHVYAKQALADVRSSQNRSCGFMGATWSTEAKDHFAWCMSQTTLSATILENASRANAAKQCGAAASTGALQQPASAGLQEQAATEFPPVVADDQTQPSTSGSAAPATSFPPVADTSTSTPASIPTMPPVIHSSAPANTSQGASAGSAADLPIVQRDDARDRVIEFEREHRREIRHAARVLKEKLKDKFSELKQHHKHADRNFGGKLKNAFKSGFSRHFARR